MIISWMRNVIMHERRLLFAQGWVLSLLLHSIAVGLAMLLVRDLQLVPQPKPFQWNVSLIETPTRTPQVIPTHKQRASAATARHNVALDRAESQPAEAKSIVQHMRSVQAVQRIVHQEMRETKPFVQAVEQPMKQPLRPVSEPATPTSITSSESVVMPSSVVVEKRTEKSLQEGVLKETVTKAAESDAVEQINTAPMSEPNLIEKELSSPSTSREVTAVIQQFVEDVPITSFEPVMDRPIVNATKTSEAVLDRMPIKENPADMAAAASSVVEARV